MQKILLVLLLVSGNAFAAEELKFQCVTRFPTTTFILRTEGDEVTLSTVHHNGTDYMPIHEGVIVPKDFEYLAAKARVLTQLGDRHTFKFPRKKCEVYGHGILSCSGGERKNFGDLNVEALHLITEEVTTKAFDFSTKFYRVTLSLNIEGHPPVHDISMQYAPEECEFGF